VASLGPVDPDTPEEAVPVEKLPDAPSLVVPGSPAAGAIG
jgi:hypothetical protein